MALPDSRAGAPPWRAAAARMMGIKSKRARVSSGKRLSRSPARCNARSVSPATASATAVAVLHRTIENIAMKWLTSAGVDTSSGSTFNFIPPPLTAGSGTGLDKVLSETTVSTGGIVSGHSATVTINATLNNSSGGGVKSMAGTNGSVHSEDGSSATIAQTSTATYNTSSGVVTVATNTSANSTTESTNSSTSVVPTNSAQQTAIADIETLMTNMAGAINTAGSNLTDAVLYNYMDTTPGVLNDGMTMREMAGYWANFLNGATVSDQLLTVKSLNLTSMPPTAEMVFDLPVATGSHNPMDLWFREVNGAWLISGNQQVSQTNLFVEASNTMGDTSSSDTGTIASMSANFPVPEGLNVSSITAYDDGTFAASTNPVNLTSSGTEDNTLLTSTGDSTL
jgi:hypothetical protein